MRNYTPFATSNQPSKFAVGRSHEKFRFSIGDTNDGAIGYAVTVEDATPQRALKIIRQDLADVIDGVDVRTGSNRMKWERLYINPEHISLEDIEMIEE